MAARGAWILFVDAGRDALVGFVTLLGITTRTSIMMVSQFEHVARHSASWGRDTASCGENKCFTPILMTALVTGPGLLPLAIDSGNAGREIDGPIAVVIPGGPCTSTLLNLLVLPTLALRFGNLGRAANEEPSEA